MNYDEWTACFVKQDKQLFENCRLSAPLKEYLFGTGLPQLDSVMFLSFETANKGQNVTVGCSDFTIIGENYEYLICIRQGDESVYTIDQYGTSKGYFVNSNLYALIQYIYIYITRQEELSDASDATAATIVEEIRKEFVKIDDKAMQDKNGFWSIFLEETKSGLC